MFVLIRKQDLMHHFIPVFEIIRDPLIPEVAKDVVQVYDLVGLTVQGYVDGKPYYGNVYFDNGVKFAGTQNTGGKTIRVFDTRTESIGLPRVETTRVSPQSDSIAPSVTPTPPSSTPSPTPTYSPPPPPPPPPPSYGY